MFITYIFRLPLPFDQCQGPQASIFLDWSHNYELISGLQELPIHVTTDKGCVYSHGGQENSH